MGTGEQGGDDQDQLRPGSRRHARRVRTRRCCVRWRTGGCTRGVRGIRRARTAHWCGDHKHPLAIGKWRGTSAGGGRVSSSSAQVGGKIDQARMLVAALLAMAALGTATSQHAFAKLAPGQAASQAAYAYLRVTDAATNIRRRIGRFRSTAVVLLVARGLPNQAAIACVDKTILPGLTERSGELLQEWSVILSSRLSAGDLDAMTRYEQSPGAQHLRASVEQVLSHIEGQGGNGGTVSLTGNPHQLPLETVALSSEDGRDIYTFSQSPAGRRWHAIEPQISTAWNAAERVWEVRALDNLLGREGASAC